MDQTKIITYIRGRCKTNLDDYQRETWPTVFSPGIRVGDCVQSKGGKILKVVRITHFITGEHPHYDHVEPYLLIELNK